MLDLKEYQRLKAQVEEAKAEASKAEGVYEQCMQRLEEEFGCKTIKEAVKALAASDAELAEAEAAYNAARDAFEKEWADVLGALPTTNR